MSVLVLGFLMVQNPPEEESLALTLAGRHFDVELAKTPQELKRGLKYRAELPANRGMLFDFEPSRKVSFWMKDVHFPLDLLFLDPAGCLLQHYDAVPPCHKAPCRLYHSDRIVKWVLELPGGTRNTLGLGIGDCVEGAVFERARPAGGR